ncbi:MAG: hypothetical protein HRU34_04165 [Richelia sp.]|nr:hypothetical protein [Richelia sp.]CDN16612.1 hypothetical protein RintRC_0578 [Richelia intracellularis]
MSETNLAHANEKFPELPNKRFQSPEEFRRSPEAQAEVERIGKANTYFLLDWDTKLFDWFDDQGDGKLCSYVTSTTGYGFLKACQLYRTQ